MVSRRSFHKPYQQATYFGNAKSSFERQRKHTEVAKHSVERVSNAGTRTGLALFGGEGLRNAGSRVSNIIGDECFGVACFGVTCFVVVAMIDWTFNVIAQSTM